MTTYHLPNRVKLRTSATRRYLIVGIYDGQAKVEASTDDENAAARLLNRYRKDYPFTKWDLLDQTGRWD